MPTHPAPANTADLLTNHMGTTTVVAEAMQSVFGMSPHDWQEDAITHITTLAKDNFCALMLLIWPMGEGGRLVVRDKAGVNTWLCCACHFSLTLSCC
jgi:hypothetical protein